MIGGIAHHVGQGIADQFQNLTIDLGGLAFQPKVDLLAEVARQLPHQTRQLVPRGADRLHPGLGDGFLQFAGDGGKSLQGRGKSPVLALPVDLQQLVAGQNQFRHQGHHVFKHVQPDADRGVHRGGDGAGGFLARRGRGRWLFRQGGGVDKTGRQDRGLGEGALQLVLGHFARTKGRRGRFS